MGLKSNEIKTDLSEKQLREIARRHVDRMKIFYIHLALYVVVVALIGLNFYIMEDGPYTDNITALNVIVLVLWTLVIFIHGWRVFWSPFLFKKRWEEKKIEDILNATEAQQEETTLWE